MTRDEIRAAKHALHSYGYSGVMQIGEDEKGLYFVTLPSSGVPASDRFRINSINGVPVRWLTFAEAAQEYRNGEPVPPTVHRCDSAGVASENDPRQRECPDCWEVVGHCACQSD